MSREIKFRAWDKRRSQMSEVFGLQWDARGVAVDVLDDRDSDNWERSGDFELMQYTGLKDKNGREIYEGDVVTLNSEMRHAAVVKFEDGAFKVVNRNVFEDLYGSYSSPRAEVIGNIYENPDLLKEVR